MKPMKTLKMQCEKNQAMYKVKPSGQYKKDLKRIINNQELTSDIRTVVNLLLKSDNPLPEKYNDHQLKGKYSAFRECHIRPDWLLVYQKKKQELILLLVKTGTHSHIFD